MASERQRTAKMHRRRLPRPPQLQSRPSERIVDRSDRPGDRSGALGVVIYPFSDPRTESP